MTELDQVISTRKANPEPPVLNFDIWHQILSYVPDVSRRMLTHLTANRFPLWSNYYELRHQKVWDLWLDKYKFLEYMNDCGYLCLLIGSDLRFLYNLNSWRALRERSLKDCSGLNLALVIFRGNTGRSSTLRRTEIRKAFRDSATDYVKGQLCISETTCMPAVLNIRHKFGQGEFCNIRLNIQSLRAITEPRLIKLDVSCGALVSLTGDYLNSSYLYWKHDWKMLRHIEPVDITGVGRYASVRGAKGWVSCVCGLNIQHPGEIPELCWHRPRCEPDSKGKRSKGWGVVCSSFHGEFFPHKVRFIAYDENRLLYRERDGGWEANYEYACGTEFYRGERDWETDPIMEKRIVISQEL